MKFTQQSPSKLDLRLAAYVAAGAALASPALTPTAKADIIVSGPLTLAVPQTADGLYINFVTGATGTTSATAPAGYDWDPYAAGTTLAFYWNPTASPDNAGLATATGTAGKYRALAAGVAVGPTSLFNTSAQTANASQFRAAAGTAYLGVRFDNEATGQVDYGYVHVQSAETDTSGFPFTILDYGYDNTGAAIVTGAVPEPTTTAALGFGALSLGAAGVRRWRKSRQAVA